MVSFHLKLIKELKMLTPNLMKHSKECETLIRSNGDGNGQRKNQNRETPQRKYHSNSVEKD